MVYYMCSICASVLGSSVLHHESSSCPLSKSLWCEFCATNGHTPFTCPDRVEREETPYFQATSYEHPEPSIHPHPHYNSAVFSIPQSEKAVRSVLKVYGGSLSGIQAENRIRLKKIVTSARFNYKSTVN